MDTFVFGIFLSFLMFFGISFSLFFYKAITGTFVTIFCIIFAIFFLVGVVLICKGYKKAIHNAKIDKYGTEAYGLISEILQINSNTNNCNEFKVTLFVYKIDNTVGIFSKNIYDNNKYNTGDFLIVKYYKGDINILSQEKSSNIDDDIKQALFDSVEFVTQLTNKCDGTDTTDDNDNIQT